MPQLPELPAESLEQPAESLVQAASTLPDAPVQQPAENGAQQSTLTAAQAQAILMTPA